MVYKPTYNWEAPPCTAFWENETFTTETKGQLIGTWRFLSAIYNRNKLNAWLKLPRETILVQVDDTTPLQKKMAQGGTPPGINWFIGHRLVGGWALPLWKMMEWKSVGMIKFPIEWENSPNVPNHQPVESIDISTINQSEIGVIRTNLANDLGYLVGHVDLCFNTKAPT